MVNSFYPTLCTPFLSLVNKTGFADDYHNLWVEFRWAAASLFRYRIYYVLNGGKIIHTSYCSPKCFKFPFMQPNDWHVGPCHTDEAFKGRGIYPAVLKHICSELQHDNNSIYMIVDADNISSTRGVLKAGFKKVGLLNKTKGLKIYTLK